MSTQTTPIQNLQKALTKIIESVANEIVEKIQKQESYDLQEILEKQIKETLKDSITAKNLFQTNLEFKNLMINELSKKVLS